RARMGTETVSRMAAPHLQRTTQADRSLRTGRLTVHSHTRQAAQKQTAAIIQRSLEMIPIIMSGGTGSRLWPLSRQLNPKQFLPLADASLSMLQATIQRLEGLDIELPRLICNEEHRFLAAEQMRKLKMEKAPILLE